LQHKTGSNENKRKMERGISPFKIHETKIARLEKIKPMILQGIGLHDKYR